MDKNPAEHPERPALPLHCARCARSPRGAENHVDWATIDGAEVCPGCLTLADGERLRNDSR